MYVTSEDIEKLVRSWEECTLPRKAFTHAAHLTVAAWHLIQHSRAEATDNIRRGLQRFNAAHGVEVSPEGGYHETLTLFWIRVVASHLAAERAIPLVDLVNGLLAKHGDKNLPFEHYTRELLFSPAARAGWVEPNLRPMPEESVSGRPMP